MPSGSCALDDGRSWRDISEKLLSALRCHRLVILSVLHENLLTSRALAVPVPGHILSVPFKDRVH